MPDQTLHTTPPCSLSRRAALAQTIIVTIIVLLFSAAIITFNAHRLNAQLDDKLSSITRMAKTSLGPAVWQVDHAAARNFINVVLQDDSVAFAQVVTGREIMASRARAEYAGKPFSFFNNNAFRVSTVEIHKYGDWIGSFNLAISTRNIRYEILLNASATIGLALILILFISQTLCYFSRKRLFSPIRKLEQSATAIAEGNLDAPIDTSSPDELGSLARAFDDMRESMRSLIGDLQGANIKLKDHRNELEATVRKRTEELNAKNRSLNQALTEVRQAKQSADVANMAKSRFLASMSHEIRTPMNAILGMADILWESELNEEQKRYVQVFKTAGESLLEILNDILDLSKIEAGRMHLEETPFSLSETVEKVCAVIEPKAVRKGLAFTCSLSPDVPDQLAGDANRLRQVLINLLDNAVKFTEQGSVHLSVNPAPGKDGLSGLQFSVTDTGSGIPTEKLDTIFDAFTQADSSTTREFGGTGLGLAISKQLVQMMRGRLWAESTPGRGSTFHFSVHFKADSRPVVLSPIQPVSPPEMAPLPGITILMVEDSKYNAFVIQTYLKDTACRITVAENGRKGVEAFKAGGVDLVLMDIQMPGMDGYEATRTIREWERDQALPRTPIVAMTAHALSEDAELCLQAGADVHLPKPVKKSALFDCIHELTKKKNITDNSTNDGEITPDR